MRWPWRRKQQRLAGNGHVVKERADRAHEDLLEALQRRAQVDRLAREMRRALGGTR